MAKDQGISGMLSKNTIISAVSNLSTAYNLTIVSLVRVPVATKATQAGVVPSPPKPSMAIAPAPRFRARSCGGGVRAALERACPFALLHRHTPRAAQAAGRKGTVLSALVFGGC